MNPVWALLFKDRWRTPFSRYKMSTAEIIVLCGIIFGIGYGVTAGVTWLVESFSNSITTK